MGHKEDLLAGAKKVLLERGFAHATARDIVAASGTNLASIGYHFGSKDALMAQAMIELMGEWGEHMAASSAPGTHASSAEKFEATWQRLLTLFAADRALIVASYEIFAQIERMPELRGMMSEAYETVRQDMAFDFLDLDPNLDPQTIRAVSSVLLALISGLTTQYMVDPQTTPTPKEIALAMKVIGQSLGSGAPGTLRRA